MSRVHLCLLALLLPACGGSAVPSEAPGPAAGAPPPQAPTPAENIAKSDAGAPTDEGCEGLDEAGCRAQNERCVALMGSALTGSSDQLCREPARFVGCVQSEACLAAITHACDPHGQLYEFGDNCGFPQGWVLSSTATEPDPSEACPRPHPLDREIKPCETDS